MHPLLRVPNNLGTPFSPHPISPTINTSTLIFLANDRPSLYHSHHTQHHSIQSSSSISKRLKTPVVNIMLRLSRFFSSFWRRLYFFSTTNTTRPLEFMRGIHELLRLRLFPASFSGEFWTQPLFWNSQPLPAFSRHRPPFPDPADYHECYCYPKVFSLNYKMFSLKYRYLHCQLLRCRPQGCHRGGSQNYWRDACQKTKKKKNHKKDEKKAVKYVM